MATSNSANGGTSVYSLEIQAVATSSTSYTLRAIIYLNSLSVTDGTNNLSVTGDWSRSGTLALSGVYSSTAVWSSDLVVARSYGAVVTKTVSSAWSSVEYWGTTLSAGPQTYDVPARAYAAPFAPSAVSGTRVSDTQHTVAWTNNRTGGPLTSAPYDSQKVQRRVNGGGWATIATGLAGDAVSYSDTTTVANRKYEWRVQAVNTTATTTSTESSAVYTTPSTPTGAAAAKDVSGNIEITWTNTAAFSEYQTEVYESQDGGGYALLATVATGISAYEHVAPSALVTHRYQVRAKTSTGTALYSGYSTTGIVTLTSAPDAPTGLAPNGATQDASGAITFTWTHNPTDTSPQSQFQIEHRATGDAWTTVTAVVSTVSSWELPAATYANGTVVEWHVRTYGESVTVSAYSATASFDTATPPTVTISAPADASTLTTSTLEAAWTFYQAESNTQAAWQAELLNAGGATIEARSASTTAATTTFATALTDATSYTLRVRVQDTSGFFSTWDSVTFSTDFLPPANVTITTAFDDVHGWMVLTLTPDATSPGVTEDVSSVTVQRRRDGGAWVTVQGGLGGNAVLIDAAPTTYGLNEYQAIVYSALPSSATMTAVEHTTTEGKWCYLSTGAGFGDVVRMFGNVAYDTSDGLAKQLHQFAGRTKPVQFSGIAETSTIAVKGLLDPTSSTLAEFQARALASTICLFRDQMGRVRFGSLSAVQGSQDWVDLANVSFAVTTVDYTG